LDKAEIMEKVKITIEVDKDMHEAISTKTMSSDMMYQMYFDNFFGVLNRSLSKFVVFEDVVIMNRETFDEWYNKSRALDYENHSKEATEAITKAIKLLKEAQYKR